eukprot:TRINITY_DN67150_c7_g1_i1.p1 TRINITY_DN67150_c7_g1~~TRINITY_DN67150_c7_g1_i1.p1  ORF type:complete len:198 (+),score=11.66 TRINITY_DN67150_c7_g1_i1:302-895(+)
MGMKTYPMITTVNIEWIRQLYTNPQPFIDTAVSAAMKHNYNGYCIDFEPEHNVTHDDGVQYAKFLTKLADALHKHGKTLGVATASWTPLWNWPLLANSSVDTLQVMSTYCSSSTTFNKRLEKEILAFSPNQLGVGMITYDASTKKPFTKEQLQSRFDALNFFNDFALELDIWVSPIPDLWWDFLASWKNHTNPQPVV